MSTERPCITLVRVGPQKALVTRPAVIQSREMMEQIRAIGRVIADAGFREPTIATYFGKPTQDLLVETPDPKAEVPALRNLLRGYDLRIHVLGRPRHLPSVFHMWRYL